MTESIRIKDFGPVRDVSIMDLRPLNVFVGESGSGKSTVMKVLAIFQWLYKMVCLRSFLKKSGVRRTPFRLRVEDLLKNSGLTGYLKQGTEIIYTNGGVELRYRKGERLSGTDTIVSHEELSLEKIAFISDKRMIIPVSLSGMVNIRHGLFYLEDTLDNFMRAWDSTPSTEVSYLGVRFETRRTGAGRRIMVVPENGASPAYTIPLHEASSGIQSVSALHYIAGYFANHFNLVESMNTAVLSFLARTDNLKEFRSQTNIGEFQRRRISIFIEEPELNLFPTNQIGLMEYLYRSFFCVPHKEGIRYQLNVATHSPYIFNHLNLMFKAAATGNTVNGAFLPRRNVNLFLMSDGQMQDLSVGNAELVNTDILSDTIEQIYDQYDLFTGQESDTDQ